MATIVRPSEADLSAIARRINSPLTDEGAQSWYRNDGGLLLQEIATLRRELAAVRREVEQARHSFYEDGAQAEPNAPLYEWAKAWKDTATGFWEKAKTKTLRDEVGTLRAEATNYKDALAAAEELNRKYASETTDLSLQVNDLRQERDALQSTLEHDKATYMKRVGEMDRLLAQTQGEAMQARADAGNRLESVTAYHDARREQVRQMLQHVMEVL